MGGKGREGGRGREGREGKGRDGKEGREWDPQEKSWLRACAVTHLLPICSQGREKFGLFLSLF